MEIKPKSYFLIGIMAVMIVVVVLSIRFRYWEAKTLPLLISSFVLLLAAWELRAELRSEDKRSESTPRPHKEDEADGELHRFCSAIGWSLGFCIGAYLLGFLIAIPLFTFSYLKVQGRNLVTSLSFAAILLGFIYLSFEFLMRAQLFRGVIF